MQVVAQPKKNTSSTTPTRGVIVVSQQLFSFLDQRASTCSIIYFTLCLLLLLTTLPTTTRAWLVISSKSSSSSSKRFIASYSNLNRLQGISRRVSTTTSSTTSSSGTSTTTSLLLAMSSSSSSSCPFSEGARKLYRKTPLILSDPLTKLIGKPVYLKLDALQPSGSFKDRGMAHLCYTLKMEQQQQKTTPGTSTTTNFISSSGGNAGLAVTTVAAQLDDVTVSVVVPETTKPLVVAKLEALGATVTVIGENWNAADAVARQRVAESGGTAEYVSPYDNPLLWTGHSTLVDETIDQLQTEYGITNQLGKLVVSVGGGGMLCGVLEGLDRRGCTTTVIAAETEGASSFGQSWKDGKGDPTNLVTLEGITSVATSLGALCVTPVAIERSLAHKGTVSSSICTDSEAIDACLRFAQDHRILVEPACGAGLAVAYSERLRQKYLMTDTKDDDGPIVLEVCGGSGVTVDLLHAWKEQFSAA